MTSPATSIPYSPAVDRPDDYINVSYRAKSWLLTVDHKRIGIMYMISITFFFLIADTN